VLIQLARRNVQPQRTNLDVFMIALVINKIALVKLVKSWDVQNHLSCKMQ